MDSIDFTTVLKLFSVTVFWSFSSVCRLFHAVGAENVKASFSQFSSVFAWWLWEQQMTKCQENKDCNFHIWSLKDLLIQLLGYLTWLITLLNDVSFSYPYLEDVYNVNFGVFRLWFLIFFLLLQEIKCGCWSSPGGYENLWGLHSVLALDIAVSLSTF